MTRDAFYKAQEIMKDLESVHMMENIINNSTLGWREDEDAPHNSHVRNDDMILCYMYRADDKSTYSKADTTLTKIINHNTYCSDSVEGDFHMGGNFIYGKDIPIELAHRLYTTIRTYEDELDNQLAELDGNYFEED